MSHTIQRAGLRLGVAAVAIGLAASGLLVASSGTAVAGSTPPTLDHFLCYQARVAGFKVPPNVVLTNQIQPKAFTPAFKNASTHCNPANKSIPGALFPSRNPLAHLLCWNITSTFGSATVTLTNQFGTSVMKTTGDPTRLCLPSWKSNIAPPNMPSPAPPGLDHFTCYPVKPVTGLYKFRVPAVKVEDEFSAPKYIPIKLSVANLLCVPTVKTVAGVAYTPATPADKSLLCFPTSPTKIWKLVFDQNQFGTGAVYPNTVHEQFCVPSTLSVQIPGKPG